MVENVGIRQHHPGIPTKPSALQRGGAGARRALHQIPRETLHLHIVRLFLHPHRRRSLNHSYRRRRRHQRSRVTVAVSQQHLHPGINVSESLSDDPAHLGGVGEVEGVEGGDAMDALEHEALEVAAFVLLLEAAELVRGLLDPLAREALLVDHLAALVHVGELAEAGEDGLRPQLRRPDLRLGVVLAVDDGAAVDAAQGAQLAHLLDQPLLPLLVRSLPL